MGRRARTEPTNPIERTERQINTLEKSIQPPGRAPASEPRFWLWRLWQHIVAPLSYPVFALGSVVLLALVPISALVFRDHKRRTRWLRGALHQGAQLWVSLTQLLRIIHVEIDDRRVPSSGPERADEQKDTPMLVIANHPSLIDVLLISAALPDLCCVLKGNLHYNPLFTLLIQHLDYLPNSDPEKMLAEGSARLQAGERLLIFPEGTRTKAVTSTHLTAARARPPLAFRFGAAELARRSGANALPVVIHYNDEYLSKGYPWYRLPPNIMRFRLEIGPIIEFPNPELTPSSSRADRKASRRSINRRWIAHFEERLGGSGMGN